MKKMFLHAAALLLSLGAWASPEVDERIKAFFESQHPEAQAVSWYQVGDLTEVYFKQDDMTCRITYDRRGGIVHTLRYYGAQHLPPFIQARVARRYADKQVFGVTEIMSAEGILYEVILEDSRQWLNVQLDAAGHIVKVVKSRKG